MNYFLVYHIGYCAGSWMCWCCNHHPAGISLLGEIHKPKQLNFEARGLDKSHIDREILNYFADREHYGDVACGISEEAIGDFSHNGRAAELRERPFELVDYIELEFGFFRLDAVKLEGHLAIETRSADTVAADSAVFPPKGQRIFPATDGGRRPGAPYRQRAGHRDIAL